MADQSLALPDDAFVEILLRLPTSARRRFRLVCKRWRDVIDERTSERQVRSKILAFISQKQRSRALIFDDGKDGPRRRHEWAYKSASDGTIRLVGTSNGLICLHDSDRTRVVGNAGATAITVANPIIPEAVALPPVPTTPYSSGDCVYEAYAFGYHPTTGQYKVVHVHSDGARHHDRVQVLTLGRDSAWREVAVPSSVTQSGRYPLCGDIVSVDGSMYWLTEQTNQVTALDLKDERFTSFHGPQLTVRHGSTFQVRRLTNVHARLGVVVWHCETGAETAEVWVLDAAAAAAAAGEQPPWSHMYRLVDSGRVRTHIILAPHLMHGEYVVQTSWDRKRLFRRKVVGDCWKNKDAKAALLPLSEQAELLLGGEIDGVLDTFSYVETTEPLPSIHNNGSRVNGISEPERKQKRRRTCNIIFGEMKSQI